MKEEVYITIKDIISLLLKMNTKEYATVFWLQKKILQQVRWIDLKEVVEADEGGDNLVEMV